jgi:putative ABC transport system permease protein
MQIPLVKGRFFNGNDGPQTTPVVVINAEMVRRYWPNQDPVGQRVRFEDSDSPWRTIVGVVGDVKRPFDKGFRPMTYTPLAQNPTYRAAFVVRTEGDPLAMAAAAREQIRKADADQAVYDIRPLESMIGDQISGVRIASQMMMVFAMIALLLAGAGIYAVMAYAVEQRTHEIGVRMALGASQRAMLKMMIVHACKLSGVGLAIGIVGALVVSRTLSSILFGVLDIEPLTFAGLVVLLAAIAVLAGYIPALRASKVDPMVALRYE